MVNELVVPGPWYVFSKERSDLPNAHIHWTRHTFAVQSFKTQILKPQEIAGAMGILLRTLYGHYARYIDNDHENIDRKIDLFQKTPVAGASSMVLDTRFELVTTSMSWRHSTAELIELVLRRKL